MFPKDIIVIATTNIGKFTEISSILRQHPQLHGFEFISLADITTITPPEENADTFLQNALLKAQYYYTQTGYNVICDDSGLCIDTLNGAPGVHSARWATGGSFEIAIQKVALLLDGRPSTAYFSCALALAINGVYTCVEGRAYVKI